MLDKKKIELIPNRPTRLPEVTLGSLKDKGEKW
jgi:hypothetical protein